MNTRQHTAYKQASHMVSKTKQVLMLYDAVIRNVKQAKSAIEDNRIEDRFNCLTKACEIITGLQLSLDHDKGGEIAKLLYDYYAGLDMRLLSVHMNNDIGTLEQCIRHLRMMREAWDEIDQDLEGGERAIQEEIPVAKEEDNLEHPYHPKIGSMIKSSEGDSSSATNVMA